MAEGIYGGFEEAQQSGDEHQLRQTAIQDWQAAQQGKMALGRTIQAMSGMPGMQAMPPGGMPPQQPQGGPVLQPMPGQRPQMPPPPQGGMPQPPQMQVPGQRPMMPPPQQQPVFQGGRMQGNLTGNYGQPPQQGGPPMQRPPQGGPQAGGPPPGSGYQAAMQGGFDIKDAAKMIAQANPGIDPKTLVEALNQALPYLKIESQQQVIQMRQMFQEQREKDLQEYRQSLIEGREKHEKGVQERFDKREERYNRQNLIKQDQFAQQQERKQQEALDKARATRDKMDIAKARLAIQAAHNAATTAIQSSSAWNTMTPEQRQKVLQEQEEHTRAALQTLESTSAGSTSSPVSQTTAPQKKGPLPADMLEKYKKEGSLPARKQQLEDMGYEVP